MDYETAISSPVSFAEACRELKAHGHAAIDHDNGELFDCVSGETISTADSDGMYSGADILAWLGY